MVVKKYRFRGNKIDTIIIDYDKQAFNYSGWGPDFWEPFGEGRHPNINNFVDEFKFDNKIECMENAIKILQSEINENQRIIGEFISEIVREAYKND